FRNRPQNMNLSSKDIPTTRVALTSQSTSLTTPNFEIECVVESDAQSDNESDEKSGNVSDEQSGNVSDEKSGNVSDEQSGNVSDELSDDESEEQLKIYEGQVFQTVKEAHITVESFAHSNGFGVCKGRVEKDANGHEISRSFYAVMLENHQPKIDRITRMNLVHVVLIVTRRLTYTGLTKDMVKDIEFYTLIGKINASAQYRLLLEKYKVPIYRGNLYNAISKVKKKDSHERFPKAAQYLNRALSSDRQSWARAYTFRHFTAGAQATSRV
ncbi:18949_t:CDS:2, partial [Gigaspora rosea]